MFRIMLAVLLFAAVACAQAAPTSAPEAQQLAAQFGSAFKADAAFPVLTADLDGDGREDAVVVANVDNPLLDAAEFHYKVIDPYNSAFGFGDPQITHKFSAQELHPHVLLVLHNWRSPQQKFVIINIPFDKLALARVLAKKKPVACIRATEASGMKSALYWDGKKWKWQEEEVE